VGQRVRNFSSFFANRVSMLSFLGRMEDFGDPVSMLQFGHAFLRDNARAGVATKVEGRSASAVCL
jgi:hypothetical protein